MLTYPINLVGLSARKCLVVGGGPVAFRKVEGLMAAGAAVMVVAPEVVGELQALARRGEIELAPRPYEEGDAAGAFVVIVATADAALNAQIAADAMAGGALVNVVDDPEHSNFIVPAVVRRGEMTIAVSTGGASPALARRLRQQLDAQFGPEYEDLMEILARLRPELIARFAAGAPRLNAALRLVDADLPARLREQGKEATLEHARRLLDRD